MSFIRCFSSVGNRRVGKQRLSIGNGCDRIATIEHEFLHALGFWHEQSRADRDDYVTIMWDRISEGIEFFKVYQMGYLERETSHTSYDCTGKAYTVP